MKFIVFSLLAMLVATSSIASASEQHPQHTSKYSGQENRSIKSLSPEDISELKRGGGWGLAKAAELNGVPGPIHLLELKDQIPLTASQVLEINAVYEVMKAQATELGLRLITLEQELEKHFQERSITDQTLRSSLERISDVRKELRYAHLSAHLRTPEILSEAQILKYNSLRGYNSSAGLCANVPKGHNAKMWRKHNGCE